MSPISGGSQPGAGWPIDSFGERLLSLIDDGRRTATYKLALLIALIDCCAESVSTTGDAPTELTTRAIARRMADLYWPQLRPFPTTTGMVNLRQITNKSSAIIRVLTTLFDSLPNATSWRAAERIAPRHAADVLDVVELTTARYPLVRLQTVDGVPQPFLYDIDWGEGVTVAQLHTGQGGRVRLKGHAGDNLLRLAPLVRPLVELHWIRMVAGLNALDLAENDLRRHLFGAERTAFPSQLRRGLAELQMGICPYCGRPVSAGATAIDHFIPWARWPNDSIENLVLAHASCNSHKSDHVPGWRPLAAWTERLAGHAADLSALAQRVGWHDGRDRTLSLARSLYAHLPDGSSVWEGPGEVSPLRRDDMLGLLAKL